MGKSIFSARASPLAALQWQRVAWRLFNCHCAMQMTYHLLIGLNWKELQGEGEREIQRRWQLRCIVVCRCRSILCGPITLTCFSLYCAWSICPIMQPSPGHAGDICSATGDTVYGAQAKALVISSLSITELSNASNLALLERQTGFPLTEPSICGRR